MTTITNSQSGSSIRAYLNAMLSPIVNVKDPAYGATGDGSTNDTAAIQAAIDAAWGTAAAPHGQTNSSLNKELYFPPGNYIITSPLIATQVFGGVMRGGGRGTTTIQQNTANTSVFVTNGFDRCRVEGIQFRGAGPGTWHFTNGTPDTGGYPQHSAFDLNWDGGNIGGVGGALQSNLFIHCDFGNTAIGTRIGQAGNQGSENHFLNCFWDTCNIAGMAVKNQNALQIWVNTGNVANCGIGLWVPGGGGSIPIIHGVSFQQNRIADISIQASSPDTYHIAGCRSENTFDFLHATNGVFSIQGNLHISRRPLLTSVDNAGTGGRVRVIIDANETTTVGWAAGDDVYVTGVTGLSTPNQTIYSNAIGGLVLVLNSTDTVSGITAGAMVTNDGTTGHFVKNLTEGAFIAGNTLKLSDITGPGPLGLGLNVFYRTDYLDAFTGTIDKLPFRRRVEPYTGNKTLSNGWSDQLCTNTGASGAITVTLPSITNGNKWQGTKFAAYVTDAQTLTLKAAGGARIRDGATLSAVDGTTASNTIGNYMELTAVPFISLPVTAIGAGAGTKTRLTVPSTALLTTGDWVVIFATLYPTDSTVSDNASTITVIDGTHVDLNFMIYDAAVAARFVTGGTLQVAGWASTAKLGSWTTT